MLVYVSGQEDFSVWTLHKKYDKMYLFKSNKYWDCCLNAINLPSAWILILQINFFFKFYFAPIQMNKLSVCSIHYTFMLTHTLFLIELNFYIKYIIVFFFRKMYTYLAWKGLLQWHLFGQQLQASFQCFYAIQCDCIYWFNKKKINQ